MARLIVLDAGVAIAALSVDDAHHQAATAALGAAEEDDLVLAATTRAELLVGPCRKGGAARSMATQFADGCATVPVTAPLAEAAAELRGRHRVLSLPDAIALAVAELIGADVIWTFDRRWSPIDERVRVPS